MPPSKSMHKDFTYLDPEGSFTWINPISAQREYLVPPADREEAIRLFEGHPDFEKLRRAYREAGEPEAGATNVQDAVRSGLKRVQDMAEEIRRERNKRARTEKPGRSCPGVNFESTEERP